MKAYNIIKVNSDSDYAYLIVMCNANSPHNYLDNLVKDLADVEVNGKILIDQMLHTGNGKKRFLEYEIINNKMVNGSFVNIKKDSIYRKKSCEFLKNSNILEGSILTSIQNRMINKGIVI